MIHDNNTCADPESFVRGGLNLITILLVDEGIEDPNTASTARQQNTDDGPTLNVDLVAS